VRDLVRSLAGAHTVLIASHILPEIEKIASRVMILLDGRLLTADALKESSGVLKLRLVAAAPEATIRGALAAIAGIRSITSDPDGATGGHYLIEAAREPSLAADIIAALVGHGIAVSELAEIPPDLERVFLDLTRRRVKDASKEASKEAA
jgi:ABC-2 type transport system ATP-binding protein